MCVSRVRVDTKTEIRKVALELFAQQGFDRTSLREIAERLDITKAALYYHYPSKNDLLRAIVTPLADDLRALVERHGPDPQDGEPLANPKALLYDYFDVCVRHSAMLIAVINDVGALSRSGLIEVLLDRRLRLAPPRPGEGPPASAGLGAVSALGGVRDAVVCAPA